MTCGVFLSAGPALERSETGDERQVTAGQLREPTNRIDFQPDSIISRGGIKFLMPRKRLDNRDKWPGITDQGGAARRGRSSDGIGARRTARSWLGSLLIGGELRDHQSAPMMALRPIPAGRERSGRLKPGPHRILRRCSMAGTALTGAVRTGRPSRGPTATPVSDRVRFRQRKVIGYGRM